MPVFPPNDDAAPGPWHQAVCPVQRWPWLRPCRSGWIHPSSVAILGWDGMRSVMRKNSKFCVSCGRYQRCGNMNHITTQLMGWYQRCGWFIWVVSESKMPKSSGYSFYLILGDLRQFIHMKHCNNSKDFSPYCAIISGSILEPESTLTVFGQSGTTSSAIGCSLKYPYSVVKQKKIETQKYLPTQWSTMWEL